MLVSTPGESREILIQYAKQCRIYMCCCNVLTLLSKLNCTAGHNELSMASCIMEISLYKIPERSISTPYVCWFNEPISVGYTHVLKQASRTELLLSVQYIPVSCAAIGWVVFCTEWYHVAENKIRLCSHADNLPGICPHSGRMDKVSWGTTLTSAQGHANVTISS